MATTRRFITHGVGDKATNDKNDVKSLQMLMIAAGETVEGGADGGWGDKTARALESFQRKCVGQGVKTQRLVSPGDYVLLLAAWRANILIPMPGKSGMAGVDAMHDWFVTNNIKYNAGAEKGGGNRAVFGVHGDTRYAVQTTNRSFSAGPVEMDCTTYVNLMLSIFINGHVHTAPYDADCSAYGDVSAHHCARDRYGLPLVRRSLAQGQKVVLENYFKTAEQLNDAVGSDANGLYVLEIATAGTGSVTHMALLQGGTTYECTNGQAGSACVTRTLEEFVGRRRGKIYYLFGPSPTRR